MFNNRTYVALLSGLLMLPTSSLADELDLSLRYQQEVAPGTQRYHRLEKEEQWPAARTAIIVCDVWDAHHSINAVRRLEEFVPRLNDVLNEARKQGVVIIHSPSDCMPAYKDHPARQRAIRAPVAANSPEAMAIWCSKIPTEELAVYPVDQSDGGEDDDPTEHEQWTKRLAEQGRNPSMPWLRQHPSIEIDSKADYISDRGDEVWNILESRKISHVILTGVHTNMCVLGRPFGLRQMVRAGKQVALMRDMTDTMYNPQRWPYVSHFTGTDLIIDHIERFVCPTVTSDQILGGQPFRFKNDNRPHVVFLMGEKLYQTDVSLPPFALANLGKQFRISYVYADAEDGNQMPGFDAVESADVVVVSVRRRTPPKAHLDVLRRYAAAGKPLIGIRTSSHAFSIRNKQVAEGLADWPEFDQEVWGGNYHGHHSDDLRSEVATAAGAEAHPLFAHVKGEPFEQSGSLYQASPLVDGAEVLWSASAEGVSPEPVAWIFKRKDGGRSFYTSLGHPGDFDQPQFVHLLSNVIHDFAGLDLPDAAVTLNQVAGLRPWAAVELTDSAREETSVDTGGVGPHWHRCAFRLPQSWKDYEDVGLTVRGAERIEAWLNGVKLSTVDVDSTDGSKFLLSREQLDAEETHLLVVRTEGTTALPRAPVIVSGAQTFVLSGKWQHRRGSDSANSGMPLPAKFGIASDIYILQGDQK